MWHASSASMSPARVPQRIAENAPRGIPSRRQALELHPIRCTDHQFGILNCDLYVCFIAGTVRRS